MKNAKSLSHLHKPMIYEGLDKTRSKFFDRLGNAGQFLKTPAMMDDFDQMTVPECRDFVKRIEGYMREWAVKLT